jgi:hypothetical protein
MEDFFTKPSEVLSFAGAIGLTGYLFAIFQHYYMGTNILVLDIFIQAVFFVLLLLQFLWIWYLSVEAARNKAKKQKAVKGRKND